MTVFCRVSSPFSGTTDQDLQHSGISGNEGISCVIDPVAKLSSIALS